MGCQLLKNVLLTYVRKKKTNKNKNIISLVFHVCFHNIYI